MSSARSIHNGTLIYITRCVGHPRSIQNGAAVLDRTRDVVRDVYRKPIVFDEVKYEGDIVKRWGQLSARILSSDSGTDLSPAATSAQRNFRATPDPWLAGGGELRGQSVPRLAFLRKIMETGPARRHQSHRQMAGRTHGRQGGRSNYLIYFGRETPKSWPFLLYKKLLETASRSG